MDETKGMMKKKEKEMRTKGLKPNAERPMSKRDLLGKVDRLTGGVAGERDSRSILNKSFVPMLKGKKIKAMTRRKKKMR